MRASAKIGADARSEAEEAAKSAGLEAEAAQLEMRRSMEAAAKLALDAQKVR